MTAATVLNDSAYKALANALALPPSTLLVEPHSYSSPAEYHKRICTASACIFIIDLPAKQIIQNQFTALEAPRWYDYGFFERELELAKIASDEKLLATKPTSRKRLLEV